MIDAYCYQLMGGGIIGMTAFPEFALSREAGAILSAMPLYC